MFDANQLGPIKSNPQDNLTRFDRSRPVGAPQTNKNFKKVVEEVNRRPKEKLESGEEEELPVSLFDLSANKKVKAKSKEPTTSLTKSSLLEDAGEAPVDALARKKRFEIPSHLPDQDEMLALNEDKTPTSNEAHIMIDQNDESMDENHMIAKNKTPSTDKLNLFAINENEVPVTQEDTIPILPENKMLTTDKKGVETPENKTPIPTAKNEFPLPEKNDLLTPHKEVKLPVDTNALPTDHASLVAATKKAPLPMPPRETVETNDTVAFLPKEKPAKSEKATPSGARFQEENADLSSVNPIASQPIFVDTRHAEGKQELPRSDIQSLIEKIAQGIYTIKREGSTETVINVRYPPILDGSKITLTSLNDAQAFRIAFSDLSTEGKVLLDQRLTKDSLKNALEIQGFTIQSITTTTIPDISAQSGQANNRFAREENLNEQGQRQQQQQRNRRNDERNA